MLETKLTPIESIKYNPKNPRKINDDKFNILVNSIKDAPWMLNIRPLVLNSDMVVLGGNMRLKACKHLGLKMIPTVQAEDLTKEQQDEFIIKDNLGYGEWDKDTLIADWDTEKLEEWGLDLPDETDTVTEKDDFSYATKFEVVIECRDEREQEHVFNALKEKGYTCRVLSI